jgi:hypothetical protein
MKTIKCIPYVSFLFFLVFSVFSAPAETITLTGQSDTPLGNYRIMERQPVTIDGESFKAFELSYEKSGYPILIYIDEHDNSKDYIVRSKYLEIKYVCGKSGFGVEAIFGKHMKFDHVMNNFLMDPAGYKYQMKLSEGGKTEKESLELIASNFPRLLKNISLLK